jgi:hypothetical protein
MTWIARHKTAAARASEELAAIKGFVASRRDEAISAGIVIGNFPVQTDDLSQQRITGAAVAALIDPTTTVDWKMGGGEFVTLDAPTIIAIAQAVRAHVQACFDHERTLLELIDNGETPDINSGWPSGS